ncbi:putative N-acetyltransferase san [Colletotrichum sp. SAR 10_86]|nr:putative N-acetyltransferase san [Colletotrichum sp. SAR 10_65]KAI8210749.1 putative N-acetyltransferase san [Colletotrichum sp. SAR 10_76]KAI8234591.1 putative N-acetyltransferase san [Colletotrichum sp. SAR 10_86]KAJ5003831.1 putative N-acetyltransferase san [Colletotrichum sp. SAR 10_66]
MGQLKWLQKQHDTRPGPSDSVCELRPISIRPVTPTDIQALRRINSLLLPVAYPEQFYAGALQGPFSRVITWSDTSSSSTTTQVIGGVVSRVEPSPFPPTTISSEPEHALYIQSLALLSPYRSHGLATATLDNIIAAASSVPGVNLRHVYAHVWTDNDEGIKWYTSRGFEQFGDELRGYYIKLRPDSAYIVRRSIGPLSLSSSSHRHNQTSAMAASISAGPTAAVANLPPMNTRVAAGANGDTDRPLMTPSGQSFQNRRAETEWNDLPADMAPPMLAPPRSNSASGASSRSSSAARKKKDRAYPAAAFQS